MVAWQVEWSAGSDCYSRSLYGPTGPTRRVPLSDPPPQPAQPLTLFGTKVFYGWWIVIAAFFVLALSGFFMFGMGVFFLTLEEEFSAGNRGLISLALGIAPLEGAIVGPFAGYLVDRLGPRRMMFAGITLLGSGFLLASTAQSMGVFVVYYLMMAVGIGIGFVTPPITAIGNWFIRRRGLALGIASAGFGSGAALAIVVNLLIEAFDWRGAAVAIGIILMTLGYPLASIMRHRPEAYGMLPDGDVRPRTSATASALAAPPAQRDYTAREALRTRVWWQFAIGFSLRNMLMSAFVIHFVPLLVSKDFSQSTGAVMLSMFGLMTVPWRLIGGFLADKVPHRFVAVVSVGMAALGMATLVHVSELWHVVLFLVLFSAGMGGSSSLYFAMQAHYFGRTSFATIAGFSHVISGISAMAATSMAGFTFDSTGSYSVAFYSFAVVAAIGATILFNTKPPKRLVTARAQRQTE